jgi:hypothetical protein
MSNEIPQPPPSVPGSKCGAPTNGEKLCTWAASEGGNGRCWQHAPELADIRKAIMAARSANGGAKAAAIRAAARVEDADPNATLRNANELLSALERALRRVERSTDEKATDVAKTVAALVEKASAILARTTEAENAELRALIAEKHPDLAKRLKLVP